MSNRGIVILLACALAVAGCGSSHSSSASPDSTSTLRERLLFQTNVTERLVSIKTRLDSLETELPQAGEKLGGAVRERATALHVERDTVAARAAALESATDLEWQAMKLRIAALLDSLDRRIDAAREDLRASARRKP